jgi:hypothetical protein
LWDAGVAVDGLVHVSAVSASAIPPPSPYSWPLAAPVSSFLLQPKDLDTPGVSQAVSDLVDAAALRTLRSQYLQDRTAQPGLYGNWDGIWVTDQSTTAFLYLRDGMPYEASDGLLQF